MTDHLERFNAAQLNTCHLSRDAHRFFRQPGGHYKCVRCKGIVSAEEALAYKRGLFNHDKCHHHFTSAHDGPGAPWLCVLCEIELPVTVALWLRHGEFHSERTRRVAS